MIHTTELTPSFVHFLLPSLTRPEGISCDSLPQFAPQEKALAANSYAQVTRVLSQAETKPKAALFDINGTLTKEKVIPSREDQLDPRMIGAWIAFAHHGIPLGIFSLRPDELIQVFLERNPSLAQFIAKTDNGKLFVIGNMFAGTHLQQKIDSKTGLRLEICPEPAKEEPAIQYYRMQLLLNGNTRQRVGAPKLIPFHDTLLIDNTNYASVYALLMRFMELRGASETGFYRILQNSAAHLWHVQSAAEQRGFTTEELVNLNRILSSPTT